MQVRVLLFASLRDDVGSRSLEIELPQGSSVQDLEDLLVRSYPRLARIRSAMLAAVNREYATLEQVIPENAEVAFFPPVSGG
jgi:molybdopterin synthase catalytic subunit